MSGNVRIATVMILAAALGLSGCLNVKQGYPEKRMYGLRVTPPKAREAGADSPVLRIAPFNASPAVRGNRFVYFTFRGVVRDYYNEFVAPPAALVGHAAQQHLAAAGIFKAVLEQPSRLPTDLVLEGTLVALHADQKLMTAVIEVQLLLLDDRAGEARLLMNKSYRKQVTLDEFTPQAATAGWNAALSEVLAAAEKDIAETVAKQ